MQRAAAGLEQQCVRLLKRYWGGVYGRTAVLLLGSGDNGGDALFAGARLARRGVQVTALQVLGQDCHAGGKAALLAAGGRLADADEAVQCDIAVDGITGIGGRPGLPVDTIQRLKAIRAGIIVAVDVPSGVNVDTGEVIGQTVRADVTVTFGGLKATHVIGEAAALCGDVRLIDIGITTQLTHDHPALTLPQAHDVAGWIPQPRPNDNKYSRGVAGIAAGSPEYLGAPLLACHGARSGTAGMIRYAGPAREQVAARHPEVVTTPSVADTGRVQAWLAGPGMGTDERAANELADVLGAELPTVLDADALTLVARNPCLLAERTAPLILTPHDGEYERLYGSKPTSDRARSAQALAARLNAVVLLKGFHTVIADPHGTTLVNPTGHPALATAGSGDVLSGLTVSLLASGMDCTRAAVTAAYLHGEAGAIAAERGRPVSASDIASALPTAYERLY